MAQKLPRRTAIFLRTFPRLFGFTRRASAARCSTEFRHVPSRHWRDVHLPSPSLKALRSTVGWRVKNENQQPCCADRLTVRSRSQHLVGAFVAWESDENSRDFLENQRFGSFQSPFLREKLPVFFTKETHKGLWVIQRTAPLIAVFGRSSQEIHLRKFPIHTPRLAWMRLRRPAAGKVTSKYLNLTEISPAKAFWAAGRPSAGRNPNPAR